MLWELIETATFASVLVGLVAASTWVTLLLTHAGGVAA
jgi:hypothetical protein